MAILHNHYCLDNPIMQGSYECVIERKKESDIKKRLP